MWGEELLIASHDNPAVGRNAPPAGQDEPASPEFIEGHVPTDESLIGTQYRLNREAAEQAIQNALQIEGTQGELFPEDAARGLDEQINEEYQRINNPKAPTGREKAIEDWRREQGLEGTNVLPPWANASIMDENTIDPKTQRQNVRKRKIEDRAKSGQEGSDIAEGKLTPKQKTDLPNFLQVTDPQAEALGPYDQAMREAEKLTGRAKADAINKANRLRPDFLQEQAQAIFNSYGEQLRQPSKQLEFFSDLATFGGSVLAIGWGMLAELNRLGRI